MSQSRKVASRADLCVDVVLGVGFGLFFFFQAEDGIRDRDG